MSVEEAADIARRWQDLPNWNALNRAVQNFRRYSEKAREDAAWIARCERRIKSLKEALSGKMPKAERQSLQAELTSQVAYRSGEGFQLFVKSEARNNRLADMAHSQALNLLAELQALEQIVRQHSPQLLGDVPAINPFAEPINAAECVQMMRRLEGGLLSLKPGQPPKANRRTKTNRKWTPEEVDERIKLELSSKDPERVKQWLFATADQISGWIVCDRKTVFKTTFWTEGRDEQQREWRRNNVSSQGAKVATNGRAATKRN